MKCRTSVCALGFGGGSDGMAGTAFRVRMRCAVGGEHAISGWLGARMLLELSRPDRYRDLLTREHGAFGKRRVLERVARKTLLRSRMISIMRAVSSVPPLTSAAVVTGRCGSILLRDIVRPRRAGRGRSLCAGHGVGFSVCCLVIAVRGRWLSRRPSAGALGGALGDG